MRRRSGQRGLTIVEFLAASVASSVLGAVVLVLMAGARDVFQAHTTLGQMTTSVDVATTVLRKDIWRATDVSQTGDGLPAQRLCPNDWLRLTNTSPTPPPEYPIVYCFETDPVDGVMKLRRARNNGPNWYVATHLDQDNVTADLENEPLVDIQIQLQRTINGHAYIRTANVRYRRQLQTGE